MTMQLNLPFLCIHDTIITRCESSVACDPPQLAGNCVWLGQQAVEYEPDSAMSLGSKILICVGHFGLNIANGRITQKSHRLFGGFLFFIFFK